MTRRVESGSSYRHFITDQKLLPPGFLEVDHFTQAELLEAYNSTHIMPDLDKEVVCHNLYLQSFIEGIEQKVKTDRLALVFLLAHPQMSYGGLRISFLQSDRSK